MQPTKKQIRVIAKYDGYKPYKSHDGTINTYVKPLGITVFRLDIRYTTNLTELNKVWAKVWSELSPMNKDGLDNNCPILISVIKYHNQFPAIGKEVIKSWPLYGQKKYE